MLQQWLGERFGADEPIVWTAHNGATFDHRVFRHAMDKVGFTPPSQWIFWDTLPVARRVLPKADIDGGHTLKELYNKCSGGLPVQQSVHTALEDAHALASVWQWLALQDSVTYGALPDSFQTYLQWIVYKQPTLPPTKHARSNAASAKHVHVSRNCPITALPGLGEHSAASLSSAGLKTVADLQLVYEQRGRDRRKMFVYLKQMIPRAHPAGLHRSLRWLASQSTECQEQECSQAG